MPTNDQSMLVIAAVTASVAVMAFAGLSAVAGLTAILVLAYALGKYFQVVKGGRL